MVQKNNITILTTAIFQQYCDDYFLGANAPKNILNAHIQQQLPTIIRNVEVSLNAMVNGRLYQMFPPANVVFNGTANLTAESQEITLYSMLTEAVLYKLKTGSFVNVNNSFSGNVNGNNNFSTSNSNVVGLRNDIRDKLVQLGLYKNAQFTNATTPNKYTEASPGTNQPAWTVQQTAQLNSYLSTNNFTLGGSWNFANLGIDGTPIQQYIQEQLGSLTNYNATLINYLPSNPIPLITSKDIDKWNNAQSVNLEPINASIQSLTTNLNTTNKEITSLGEQFTTVLAPYVTGSTIQTVPLITTTDITKWNNPPTVDLEPWVRRFEGIGYELETINSILENYNSNNIVPPITSTDISNWNENLNCSTILNNYINAPNQTSQAQVPLITQADIDKWNSNSGGSSTSSSVSIKEQTFTLTITNTWQIQYGNGAMSYQGSTFNVSPTLPTGLNISVSNVNNSIGSGQPYIEVSISGKTILNSLVIPYSLQLNNGDQYMISPIENMSLKVIDNVSYSVSASIEYGSWQNELQIFNVWYYWGVYTGSTNGPQSLDQNNSFCLFLNYSVGTNGTLPSTSETQNISEPMNLYLKLVYIE